MASLSPPIRGCESDAQIPRSPLVRPSVSETLYLLTSSSHGPHFTSRLTLGDLLLFSSSDRHQHVTHKPPTGTVSPAVVPLGVGAAYASTSSGWVMVLFPSTYDMI